MLQITKSDYMMGRDEIFEEDLTPEIQSNVDDLLLRVNGLLAVLITKGFQFEAHPKTKSLVASGWRPKSYNDRVPGAAKKSAHITGQAVDIFDRHGEIGKFLFREQNLLEKAGLFMEHPSRTAVWVHLQTRPVKSGNRVFLP